MLPHLPTLDDATVAELCRLAIVDELVPPPPFLPIKSNPPQGTTVAPQNTIEGDPFMFEEVCAAHNGSHSLMDYPKILNILNTDKTPEAKGLLKTLASLVLQK